MKKNIFFSFLAAGLAFGFVACNNSGESTSSTDSTNNNNSATTTHTSTNNYAARADSVRANVAAGYYLNPRTGKPYTNVTVDTLTGSLRDEAGQPIRRFVDRRTWKVYDTQLWDTVGTAEMENNNLMYRSDNGNWVTYDKRWTDDNNTGTMTDSSSTTTSKTATEENGTTSKKVKVSDNGNKVKIKKESH